MPYQSPAQRRLMEGIRHGWKPTHLKSPPSQAVATKFHDETVKHSKKRGIAGEIERRMQGGHKH